VIIPSYNVVSGKGEAVLRTALSAVADQELPPDEVILVDTSADGTDAFVREHYPWVTVAHRDERMYAGEARNAGARAASGDVLAFIDADCAPAPTWLAALGDAFARTGAAAVTGPMRGPADEPLIARVDRILHLNHMAHLETAARTMRASTSNLAVRADVFHELGGFPADLAANEDYVFCNKLVAAHGPISVAREAAVCHLSPSTLERLLHHQRRFGHGFVDGRREDPTLPGAFAVRHPALIPLLPLMRGAGIIARLAQHNRRDLLTLLGHPVLFARALGAWTQGIREGVRGEPIEWDMRLSATTAAGHGETPAGGDVDGERP